MTTDLKDQVVAITVTPLAADDIANAVLYAIGQPPNVSVGELLVRPAGQG